MPLHVFADTCPIRVSQSQRKLFLEKKKTRLPVPHLLMVKYLLVLKLVVSFSELHGVAVWLVRDCIQFYTGTASLTSISN